MKKIKIINVLINVMALLSLVGTPPAQATLMSYTAHPNVHIPDNSSSGVDTNLGILDDFLISSISVWVYISKHTWVGDLQATLWGPNNQSVILFSADTGVPGNGSDLDGRYTFRDGNSLGLFPTDGANDWIIPGGPYRAEAGSTVFESSFGNQSALGTWTLHISDNAFGDTGALISWGLDIETHTPVPEPASMLLLGAGLAGLAAARRRRKAC